MDPITLGYVGILGLSMAYHWWENRNRPKPKPEAETKIPLVAEGTAPPMFFGRVRIDRPLLVWTSEFVETNDHNDPGDGAVSPTGLDYHLDMFFVIGIPFASGNSTNRIHRIFAGGDILPTFTPYTGGGWTDLITDGGTLTPASVQSLLGTGNYERNTRWCLVWNDEDGFAASIDRPWTGGEIEFLNGNPDQQLLNPGTLAPLTRTGEKMIEHGAEPAEIPDYRGYVGVGFSGVNQADYRLNWPQWLIGFSADVPAYAFEVSSYPLSANSLTGDPLVNSAGEGGGTDVDANPADVLLDLLCGSFGKLATSIAYIDLPSWEQAARTLDAEGNGYSRVVDSHTSAEDLFSEILQQIAGLVDEDPTTQKIRLKLIRDDVSLASVPQLGPQNCLLEDYEVRGMASPVTSVRVRFNDRQRRYQDNAAVAQNMAASLASGEINEVELSMPGVTAKLLAGRIAKRELEIRSRPLSKCKVKTSREFIRVLAGDVVSLSWPEYGISRKLFRVMHVLRPLVGPLEMTLLEEVAAVHRDGLERGGLEVFPDFEFTRNPPG